MRLAIMQPYFMPYLGYFQVISAVDKFILYENLSFIKKRWMNRNRILLKNGKILLITVPLIKKSSNKIISEIRIDNNQQWRGKLLKTVYLNYKGSFFFDETYHFLEKLFEYPYDYLYQLNAHSIKFIADFLNITTQFGNNNYQYLELETKLGKIDEDDFSGFPDFKIDHTSKKVARIIEISKKEGANVFINSIGGQTLYNKDEFASHGINLFFCKIDQITYPQFSDKFIPDLSIIDVLMHNGKDKTADLVKKYILV